MVAYLALDDVVSTHAKTVELSGGGLLGSIDLGRLESVLQNIQNDEYYPTFADKLTHLFFCTAKFHCFQDGNKRTAITACVHLLIINGYLYCAKRFLHEMENIAVHVADDTISKELLGEIIVAMIAQDDENEELKLKVFEAISAKASAAEVALTPSKLMPIHDSGGGVVLYDVYIGDVWHGSRRTREQGEALIKSVSE